MLSWQDYTAAARELSPSALNLFMYLAKNQDKYEMWFSSKDYCEIFNVSDRTFRNAKKELIAKGYLKEGQNNNIYFDTSGAYKETLETLKNYVVELGEKIKLIDEDRCADFKEAIYESDVKNIQDELLKKKKLKELINFGEDILKDIAAGEFKELL